MPALIGARRVLTLRKGGGDGLPALPLGYAFLVTAAGEYIVTSDGSYIIVEA